MSPSHQICMLESQPARPQAYPCLETRQLRPVSRDEAMWCGSPNPTSPGPSGKGASGHRPQRDSHARTRVPAPEGPHAAPGLADTISPAHAASLWPLFGGLAWDPPREGHPQAHCCLEGGWLPAAPATQQAGGPASSRGQTEGAGLTATHDAGVETQGTVGTGRESGPWPRSESHGQALCFSHCPSWRGGLRAPESRSWGTTVSGTHPGPDPGHLTHHLIAPS